VVLHWKRTLWPTTTTCDSEGYNSTEGGSRRSTSSTEEALDDVVAHVAVHTYTPRSDTEAEDSDSPADDDNTSSEPT
jgi:hypothetical protein